MKFGKTKTLIISSIVIVVMVSSCALNGHSVEADYYGKLDDIRKHKHQQLVQYMANVQHVAGTINNDHVIKNLFVEKNKIYRKYKNTKPPEDVLFSLYQLRDAIENQYIERYLIFSDILFVNLEGDIFYTVRRQADYHKNIFGEELAGTNLSYQLKNHPSNKFVDFQNYKISGDPAAFFVEPFMNGSEMIGWFVLQFSINKINDLFSVEEELGQTGEVFLVNKDCYMLTDSRFFAESTILKKHLSEQNIRAKFSERNGHKLVTDYRGYRAITSFEVISLLDSEWLLIAKIDEDEIHTENYKKNKNFFDTQILDLVKQESRKYNKTNSNINKQIVVDVDEFKRAAKEETLYTHGVSTCTALIISHKDKFGYLAHISAYDWLYEGSQTDLARRMLDRIEKFDVAQNDKREIEITLVSPNLPDTAMLIDALIDWGIFLSQITMVSNQEARYANLSHNYRDSETLVEWKLTGKSDKSVKTTLNDTKNLGELFKAVKS